MKSYEERRFFISATTGLPFVERKYYNVTGPETEEGTAPVLAAIYNLASEDDKEIGEKAYDDTVAKTAEANAATSAQLDAFAQSNRDINAKAKAQLADELKKIGLSAGAIATLLNR